MEHVINTGLLDTSFIKTTNIVILGMQGAGKSTIFNQFRGYFEPKHPAVTPVDRNRLEIVTEKVRTVVFDINLPERLTNVSMYSVTKGDAFVLVYDIGDNKSFEYVERVKDFLVAKKGEACPIIVVGNKKDLPDRAFQYEVVDCLVSIDWDMKYFEFSAITDDMVPTLLEVVFSRKTQHAFLQNGENDFDTFEFRGIKFRPRAKTDSNLLKSQVRTDRDLIASLVARGILPETKRQGKTRHRLSLPSFSLFRGSPAKGRSASIDSGDDLAGKKTTALISRCFTCVKRNESMKRQ